VLSAGGTGTLRLNVQSGSPGVAAATGVIATVASTATLELDGMTSALTDSTTALDRTSIQNAGAVVIGNATVTPTTMQQVGGIDGAGSTTVADNAMLTADHINQTLLVIGNGSVFTLAPSDANGNPMAAGGGLVLAGSLTPSSSFIAGSGSLVGTGVADASISPVSLGGVSGASLSAVPEPTTGLLLALGAFGLFGVGAVRRRKSAR
jgi:hypothetical protein